MTKEIRQSWSRDFEKNVDNPNIAAHVHTLYDIVLNILSLADVEHSKTKILIQKCLPWFSNYKRLQLINCGV